MRITVPMLTNLLRELVLLGMMVDVITAAVVMVRVMVGTKLIHRVLLQLLHRLARLVTLLEAMAEADPAHLVARLMIRLVVVAVETDHPMSMACFLLICVLRVCRLMMKLYARDVDEIAPVHQQGTACHASIDVARSVALIR